MQKNYSFHNFLNRSNFPSVCYFSNEKLSPQEMVMLWLCLHHSTYLNSASNVFVYLLIIFLRHDWFWFFLNVDALDPLHNVILAQMTPLGSN